MNIENTKLLRWKAFEQIVLLEKLCSPTIKKIEYK